MVTSTCAHESVLWDVDEYRCWTCSRSLTFPPRAPGSEDATDRRRDARRTSTPVEEVEEVEASPSTQLLICHCCKEMLPLESFSARNHPAAKNRQFRASRCRACMAVRLQHDRAQDPEGIRERDRLRNVGYREKARAEGQAPTPTEASTAANTLASQRYRARQDGRGVPLQRPGRRPIHVKPICKIAAGVSIEGVLHNRKQRAGLAFQRLFTGLTVPIPANLF